LIAFFRIETIAYKFRLDFIYQIDTIHQSDI